VANAYVLDSYAMIAHLEDEAAGTKVRRILKSAQAGQTKLYMSVINLGEIYYNTHRERGREKADEALFMIRQLPVTIIEADIDITIEAAELNKLFLWKTEEKSEEVDKNKIGVDRYSCLYPIISWKTRVGRQGDYTRKD